LRVHAYGQPGLFPFRGDPLQEFLRRARYDPKSLTPLNLAHRMLAILNPPSSACLRFEVAFLSFDKRESPPRQPPYDEASSPPFPPETPPFPVSPTLSQRPNTTTPRFTCEILELEFCSPTVMSKFVRPNLVINHPLFFPSLHVTHQPISFVSHPPPPCPPPPFFVLLCINSCYMFLSACCHPPTPTTQYSRATNSLYFFCHFRFSLSSVLCYLPPTVTRLATILLFCVSPVRVCVYVCVSVYVFLHRDVTGDESWVPSAPPP